LTETLTRPRRSYSRLSTWQECPQAYKAKYVDKIPEEPSVWSVGGTAFHTVAEQYLRGDLGPNPDEALLFRTWLEAWRGAYEDVISSPRFVGSTDMRTWRAADRGHEDQDWWVENGLRMVHRFVDWKRTIGRDLQVFELDGRPALERHIEVELGGVPVILIPDAVIVDEHGQVGILDYKTGKPPKKPTQLHFYAAGLAEIDVHATWGLYYMARPGQLLSTEIQMHHVNDVVAQLIEFDERERAGDYDLQPGQECLAYQCPTHARSKRR
jgi:RecB family exonuclease